MTPALPFTPPEEQTCLALYHGDDNAWWVVTNTSRSEDIAVWRRAIGATGGVLRGHESAASFAIRAPSWLRLAQAARKRLAEGFFVAAGGLQHISPQGTRWLRADPSLWWGMQSASVEQLRVIKSSEQGSNLVMTALARQGYLGIKQNRALPYGPSVVRHRWKEVFPEEMVFCEQCKNLGLDVGNALALWKTRHTPQSMVVQNEDLSCLLNCDCR